MPSTYKTPGVYIEEISKFPPSVAQVETAVPAFIGYTAIASKNGEDLRGKPTKITSLAEYNVYFGEGPDSNYQTYLDTNDTVSQVVPSLNYYMYDSLRMFYANGGGKCYIISVGLFPAAIAVADLTGALAALEKQDEPTMILCPDAALLSGTGLYDFQVLAIQQSAKLGDRVTICDLLKIDEKAAGQTLNDRVTEFRDKIGINDLKYGVAYIPYIKSSLPKTVIYRNIDLRQGTPAAFSSTSLENFTSDNGILQIIYDLQNAKKANDDLTTIATTTAAPGILTGSGKTISDEFKKLFAAFPASGTDDAKVNALQPIYQFCAKILASVYDEQQALPAKVATVPNPASKTASKSFVLRTDIDTIVSSTGINTTFRGLLQHHVAYAASTGIIAPGDQLFNPATDFQSAATNAGKAALLLQFATPVNIAAFDITTLQDAALNASYTGAADDTARITSAFKAVSGAYTSFISFFIRLQSAASQYEKTLDSSLANVSGFYKNILDKIQSSVSDLPPSGAVAGIYAKVDNDRGVWKAPANVSISSVVGPTVLIDNTAQDDLNVDVNAGKSINAIRSFTGKGTIIWGARTLAGNDNEWRYVPVRRFFNMVEESVKKASSQFVFEPNDANTWVKIKAMIENYLTILWRQGALTGAKAEQAFFVKVGLGETMTSIDILEGRMNIEIGMAAVRPAEFIILKFSHKMQES